jgi:hypothetical protein
MAWAMGLSMLRVALYGSEVGVIRAEGIGCFRLYALTRIGAIARDSAASTRRRLLTSGEARSESSAGLAPLTIDAKGSGLDL